MENQSNEAMEALTAVKLVGLKKKEINAESWNSNMENLLKSWGEKAAGLRFMHSNAAQSWKKFSNTLSLFSIGITTISSGISLVATGITDEADKNIILYCVGVVGICSGLLQSLKKFYNAEEKAADHTAIAKQFGSFYRYVSLQMALSREDRMPSDNLTEQTLKEYERLQQDAPPLNGKQIQLYKYTFKNSNQSTPDICEDKFEIKIYRPYQEELYQDELQQDELQQDELHQDEP